MLLLKVALLLLAGIANCFLAIVVLARGRRRLSSASFFVLLFAVGGWSIGIAGFLLTHSDSLALAWAKIYYAFPLLIAVSLVYFVHTFPDRSFAAVPRTWQAIALVGFAVNTILLLGSTNYLTAGIAQHAWGKEVILQAFPYDLYGIYLLICFAGSLFVILQRSKVLQGLYAKQARLFFYGFGTSSLFGVIFNLILPGIGNYRLIWLGPIFTSILSTTMAISIVRHKMFDVRTFVVRTIAYAATVVVVASLFGLVVFGTANLIFTMQVSLLAQVYISLGTALAALIFSRLKSFFDRVSNQLFYQDAYDTQVLLDDLNRVLVASSGLDQLLKQSALVISDSFKTEFCYFDLREASHAEERLTGQGVRRLSRSDSETIRELAPRIRHKIVFADDLDGSQNALKQVLQANNIALLGRLTANTKHTTDGMGYLVMGARRSGNPFTNKDIRTLEILVNELVIAIENALRFEQIQHFNETLQDNISEATRKLRQTNEKLQGLDETKDEFITMASHQLRTPLTAVKGYLSMVLEGDAGKLNANQRKLLEQSYISSQRMVYLIADLLNLSRLSTGRFIIDSVPTNLAEVVQAEVNQLEETARSRELTLDYTPPETFPELMLDETKIHQVVMNFIDNAIYYTPPGGTIKIQLRETPQNIEYLVHDSGIGVPRSEQRHLFTKFYRADNAKKARPDGTGLGLFMAKKVIATQGGAIIFESEEGKGSTFGFRFGKRTHAVHPAPTDTST